MEHTVPIQQHSMDMGIPWSVLLIIKRPPDMGSHQCITVFVLLLVGQIKLHIFFIVFLLSTMKRLHEKTKTSI